LLTIPLSALAQRLSLIGFVLVEQTERGVLVQKSRWDAPFAVGLALSVNSQSAMLISDGRITSRTSSPTAPAFTSSGESAMKTPRCG
jgi:hypothetical protein